MRLRNALRLLAATGALLVGPTTASGSEPATGMRPPLAIEAPPELAGEAARLRRLPGGALDRVVALIGSAQPGAITVVLLPERSEAARNTPAWVAGYAQGALGRIVLFPERVPRYPDTTLEELLLHEVAHVLIDRAAGYRPLPRWFHEGLASVAGGPWSLRDGGQLTLAMLRSRELTPDDLDRLFQDPGSVARAYAVATALARDLLRRHGEELVPALLARVRRGEPFETAFRGVLGLSPREAAHLFWRREAFWYRWLPVLTSSTTLWIAVTLLALVAIRKRRRRDAEIAARWEAEDALDLLSRHLPPPPPGGSS